VEKFHDPLEIFHGQSVDKHWSEGQKLQWEWATFYFRYFYPYILFYFQKCVLWSGHSTKVFVIRCFDTSWELFLPLQLFWKRSWMILKHLLIIMIISEISSSSWTSCDKHLLMALLSSEQLFAQNKRHLYYQNLIKVGQSLFISNHCLAWSTLLWR